MTNTANNSLATAEREWATVPQLCDIFGFGVTRMRDWLNQWREADKLGTLGRKFHVETVRRLLLEKSLGTN